MASRNELPLIRASRGFFQGVSGQRQFAGSARRADRREYLAIQFEKQGSCVFRLDFEFVLGRKAVFVPFSNVAGIYTLAVSLDCYMGRFSGFYLQL
jgi:hypothetical protein